MLTCAWHLWVAVQGGCGTLRLTDGAACTTKLSQLDEDRRIRVAVFHTP